MCVCHGCELGIRQVRCSRKDNNCEGRTCCCSSQTIITDILKGQSRDMDIGSVRAPERPEIITGNVQTPPTFPQGEDKSLPRLPTFLQGKDELLPWLEEWPSSLFHIVAMELNLSCLPGVNYVACLLYTDLTTFTWDAYVPLSPTLNSARLAVGSCRLCARMIPC